MTTTERRGSDALTVAPYGAWASPFKIERLTDRVVFLAEPRGIDGTRWWIEGRPDEGGRQVLIRRDPDGAVTRMTPEGFNARSRVHEYGGAASLISGDLILVSDFVTGRLNRIVAPGMLQPLTPEREWRFADAIHDAARNRLIAIREDHEPDTVAAHGEWNNELVAIDLSSGEVSVLASGSDFYASPRLSPDGTTLAWLEWHHPNMPWDGTELRLATVAADGSLAEPRTIAGSRTDWISQPRWSPDGVLHFAAEPTGWMNLYRWVGDRMEQVTNLEAELVGPDWQFGYVTYEFLDGGDILAIARSAGRDELIRVAADGSITTIDMPYTEMNALSVDGDRVVLRAAAPDKPAAVIEIDLDGNVTVLRTANPTLPDPADVSIAEHIEFPTTGGRTAYGNFYRPTSQSFQGPEGELPPLIVTSHGGPTAGAFSGFATGLQLFTSRGYAVLDVDYGGSTGYGKAYRKRLEGEWGVVDVDDCVAGARFLADRGLVDGARQAVRGGSASGFTTLAALAFTDQFDAGCTYFGIGDLRAFVKDTHKFESRYLESLLGPWPEAKQIYLDRSPSLHAERITAPVLVQQGEDDKIVPKEEAERIVDALFERRLPHAYLLYPGEDHGFRGHDAIIRSFGAELSFYAQVFGFEPADDIEPLEIQFLDEARKSA
ncbi:MAG TPA: prolyl oligopeptidase family serine peptidase [Patescibacteria group bacterium]|jgi:dipeptidyl aminopeptidase/acylaminoacyl peptidase|nr:prolyl oligopeptidase family serine peptidase [Patescibacteria group bacterium]